MPLPPAPAARPALLRELDAIVHEKFFGRCAHELIRMVHPDNEDDLGSPAFVCTKCKKVLCGVTYYEGIDLYPCYSTNIAATWSVVEKLLAILPNQDFHLEHLEHSGWAVGSCYNKEEGGWDDWTYAETPSLAICLAALQAAGEDASRFEELLTC